MSKRAAMRRVGRDIFGYRGKKAKRHRNVDPNVARGFLAEAQRLNDESKKKET